MSARVSDAVEARGPLIAGGVVDRVHLERLCADARAQRVDERLSGWSNTGRLTGSAGEHHLNIGARLGGRGWETWGERNGSAEARRREDCWTNKTNDVTSDHVEYFAPVSESQTLIFHACPILIFVGYRHTENLQPVGSVRAAGWGRGMLAWLSLREAQCYTATT
jgi:hypothetical protein